MFDTTKSREESGAPTEADFERIRNAKSHQEAYPEQYRHPRVGELVSVQWKGLEVTRGTIERVVGSRFGQMAKLDTDDNETFRLLAACAKVEV